MRRIIAMQEAETMAGKFARVTVLIVLAGFLGFVSVASLRAQAAPSLNGAWVFNVVTDAGGGTPTVTFKQDGEKLSGHYSSEVFGEQDFTGMVKGKEFSFKFGDGDMAVEYKGTIESANSLKGTAEFAGIGSGTFTAERKK
jgi:hypothetical protein